MRVLVAGDFAFRIYEPDFCEGLRRAGAEVVELHAFPWTRTGGLARRVQTRLAAGPEPLAANARLLAAVARQRAEVVLAWRTPWLSRWTLRACQALGAKVILYNNDDPFGPDRDRWIWRRFRRLVPLADACLAYREVNLAEYEAAGARRVALMRSSFNPELHRPIRLTEEDRARFAHDVVFVGHCEDDERLEALDRLLRTKHRVGLFGTGWEQFARGRAWESRIPVARLEGEDYVKAIAGAKIALAFLSRRNRDQYTRRCFEIPAIGTMMLAPRTPELLQLFAEDVDAAYFSSVDELMAKVERYLGDEAARARIAASGRRRCVEGGHDVVSRARELLRYVEALP